VYGGFFKLEIVVNDVAEEYQAGRKEKTDQTNGGLGSAYLLCWRPAIAEYDKRNFLSHGGIP
jgi:hypothetical protein